MNFNSHLIDVKREVIDSLSRNKEDLVNGVLTNTKRTAKLLKTDSFNFWIDQLEDIDWRDLPITQYAIDQEKEKWEKLNPKQKGLIEAIRITLERLFTFWEEDDLCEMQGQFFYFKNDNNDQLFYESEFGRIRNYGNNMESVEVKIATIQNLKNKGILNKNNEKHLLK